MKFTSQYFSLWCHPYCRGGRENFVIRKIMSSEVDSIYFGIKIAFLQWHVAGKSHGGNNIRCHKNDVEYLEYLLEYLFILTALIWSDTGHYFILDSTHVNLYWMLSLAEGLPSTRSSNLCRELGPIILMKSKRLTKTEATYKAATMKRFQTWR